MIRLADDQEVEKIPFTYSTHFMGMRHNYVCSVCKDESGVQNCNTGILEPCRTCQQKGYRVIKLTWFDKLLGRDK